MTPLNITSAPLSLDVAARLNGRLIPSGVAVAVLPGRVYDRIISTTIDGERDILAFVKRDTSRIMTPASWSRPSLNRPSFDLSTEFDAAVEHFQNKN